MLSCASAGSWWVGHPGWLWWLRLGYLKELGSLSLRSLILQQTSQACSYGICRFLRKQGEELSGLSGWDLQWAQCHSCHILLIKMCPGSGADSISLWEEIQGIVVILPSTTIAFWHYGTKTFLQIRRVGQDYAPSSILETS